MSNEIMYEIINNERVQVSDTRKAQIIAYKENNAYIAKRASEYPNITDYIDGVVKSDQAQIDKYIADCLAIKTTYPKGA
jgi:hypothetical protein